MCVIRPSCISVKTQYNIIFGYVSKRKGGEGVRKAPYRSDKCAVDEHCYTSLAIIQFVNIGLVITGLTSSEYSVSGVCVLSTSGCSATYASPNGHPLECVLSYCGLKESPIADNHGVWVFSFNGEKAKN